MLINLENNNEQPEKRTESEQNPNTNPGVPRTESEQNPNTNPKVPRTESEQNPNAFSKLKNEPPDGAGC
jgi:hypothetical protein